MKIAASDFDGTLCRNNQVSQEDLKAISAWRAKGHLFGVATGRDLNMIRTETEGWGIPFDFLITNNGAGIYDQDYQPLNLINLPAEAAELVIKHPATKGSRYCFFSSQGQSYIQMFAQHSWLTSLGLDLKPINSHEALELKDLQQIGFEYATPEESRRAAEAINRDLGFKLQAQQSHINLDIMALGVSKAQGLNIYLDLIKASPKEILAIGDSQNDLSMISHFQGFAVTAAPQEVKAVAQAVVASPAEMLEANL